MRITDSAFGGLRCLIQRSNSYRIRFGFGNLGMLLSTTYLEKGSENDAVLVLSNLADILLQASSEGSRFDDNLAVI